VIDHAHLLVRSNPKLLGGLFSLAKAAQRSICILLISNSYLRYKRYYVLLCAILSTAL
jgi:hypothetical protein